MNTSFALGSLTGYGFHWGLDHTHSVGLGQIEGSKRSRAQQNFAEEGLFLQIIPSDRVPLGLKAPATGNPLQVDFSILISQQRTDSPVPCGVQQGASTCALTTLISPENNQRSYCSQCSSTFLCKVPSLLV